MMVTFVTEGPPCSCGLRPRGAEVAWVRVNRRSLRSDGIVLGTMPPGCVECLMPLVQLRRVRCLVPSSTAAVDAYRARKWPA